MITRDYTEEIAEFIKQGYIFGQFEGDDGKTIAWSAQIDFNEVS